MCLCSQTCACAHKHVPVLTKMCLCSQKCACAHKRYQAPPHPSCITWEQGTPEWLAPSEMKLRGGTLGTRTLDLTSVTMSQTLAAVVMTHWKLYYLSLGLQLDNIDGPVPCITADVAVHWWW